MYDLCLNLTKDISSISGSDSENDEENRDRSEQSSSSEDDSNNPHYAQVARSKPKISFRLKDSTILVMFRCILHGRRV